ncbi:MAG: alpha/beta hydrolase [Pseudomonadota bacterium]
MTKIIFVHGMAANAESWNGVENDSRIKSFGDTSAVTLAGHTVKWFLSFGVPNPASPPSVTMDQYVASVVGDFPASGGANDVVLIGHSMGGFVISEVAVRYPNRVKALIYVAAMLPSNNDTISGLASTFGTTPQGVIEEFIGHPSGWSALVKQPGGPLSFEFKTSDEFDDIPKTYIYTANDLIIPLASQNLMTSAASSLSGKNMTTGHLPQFENKDALVNLLAGIL